MEDEEFAERLHWNVEGKEVPVMIATLGRLLRAMDAHTGHRYNILDRANKFVTLRREWSKLSREELEHKKGATTHTGAALQMLLAFKPTSRIYDVTALFAASVIHVMDSSGGTFDLHKFGRWCLEQPVDTGASLFSELDDLAALGTVRQQRHRNRQLLRERERADLLRRSYLYGRLPAAIAWALFDEETLREAGIHSIDYGMRHMFGAVHMHGIAYDPWRITGREYFHAGGHNNAEDARVAELEARQAAQEPGAPAPSKKTSRELAAELRFEIDQRKDIHIVNVVADMRCASDAAHGEKCMDFVCIVGDSGFTGGHGSRQPGARFGDGKLEKFFLCVEMDEFFSSQRCPRCLGQSDFWKPGNYRVKCCHSCTGEHGAHDDDDDEVEAEHEFESAAPRAKEASRSAASGKVRKPFIFDRDTAAAVNFITIFLYMCSNNGARPPEFRRSELPAATKAACLIHDEGHKSLK